MKTIKKHSIKKEKRVKKDEIIRMHRLHNEFEEKVNERIKNISSVLPEERLERRKLQESEKLFRTTFEHAAVGIAHVRLKDGRWLRANKRFCEITGWSEKELLQQTFLDTTHPDDHKKDLELVGSILEGKTEIISMEKRYVRKDGTIRWVYATASIIRYPSGKPHYGIAIVEDIHEKKETEKQLQTLAQASKILGRSLDYNETLGDIADLMVPQLADWCVIDLLTENGEYQCVKVAYANPDDKELAEFLQKNASKKHDKRCISGKVALSKKAILIPNVKGSAEKGCPYAKDPVNSAASKIKTKSLMVVPLVARNQVLGIMSLRSTHPVRRYSKADLVLVEHLAHRAGLAVDNARLFRRAQRAVAVRDDFLGIASHELKTSLTTVKALTQILQRDLAADKSQHRLGLLTKMDTQLNRTTKLINDLLDVSKMHTGKILVRKELLDMNSVVEDAVENCRRSSSNHEIVLEVDAHEKVFADKERISQVITNIITNAVKYSPDREKVIVRVYKSEDMKSVVIGVRDFGIGIIEENRSKIFDRFFRADSTIKDSVSGVGLGLYISQKLIEQLGGDIWVDSKVGEGSTFYVSLPIATSKMEQFNSTKMSKS